MSKIHAASRGYKRGKYKNRSRDVVGIVIHTTGWGSWKRWKRDNPNAPELTDYTGMDLDQFNWAEWKSRRGDESHPFDTCLRIYGSLMDAGPHFVVCGETGRVAITCPPEKVAWHVGSRKSWKYKFKGWKRNCGWWQERWPELEGPQDLLGGLLWRHGRCNDLTIGIEVSPPRRGAQAAWSEACWESLRTLVAEIASDSDHITLDEYHIITHSDAHPVSRTGRNPSLRRTGRPTDPGQYQWARAFVSQKLLP